MKKWILCLLTFSTALSLMSCSSDTAPSSDISHSSKKTSSVLSVSVTFDAMAEFVNAVGKDKVAVTTIVPTGVEPHDFEPKASDIAGLSKAQVVVYNGLGMDSWITDAVQAAENNSLTVIDSSKNSISLENSDSIASDKTKDAVATADTTRKYDPHLWLSIKSAEIQVQNIADGLSQADPANKEFYQENATSYIDSLDAVYNEYKPQFASLPNKSFVTGHAAFGYFCRDFGLSQKSVEDVFAEGEPSTRQLADLVDYCRSNDVTTIFAEKMASPEISKTLANEVGASVETIYTMESAEDNLTYLERMQKNCEKIYNSLSR